MVSEKVKNKSYVTLIFAFDGDLERMLILGYCLLYNCISKFPCDETLFRMFDIASQTNPYFGRKSKRNLD